MDFYILVEGGVQKDRGRIHDWLSIGNRPLVLVHGLFLGTSETLPIVGKSMVCRCFALNPLILDAATIDPALRSLRIQALTDDDMVVEALPSQHG